MPAPETEKAPRAAEAKAHGRRAGLFAFFGLFNTATDVGVYAAFVALGLSPLIANGVGFLVANLQSYLLNASLTFRRAGKPAARSLRGYGRFIAAHLLGLAISTTAIIVLSGPVGPYWAKIAAIAFTFVSNYALSAFFVFRDPRD